MINGARGAFSVSSVGVGAVGVVSIPLAICCRSGVNNSPTGSKTALSVSTVEMTSGLGGAIPVTGARRTSSVLGDGAGVVGAGSVVPAVCWAFGANSSISGWAMLGSSRR